MRNIKPVYPRRKNTTTDLVETEVGVSGLANLRQPPPHTELIPDELLTGRQLLRSDHGAVLQRLDKVKVTADEEVVTGDELRKEKLKNLQPECGVGGEVQIKNLKGEAIGRGIKRGEVGDENMAGQLVRDRGDNHIKVGRDKPRKNGDDTRRAITIAVEDRVMAKKGQPLEGGRVRRGEMGFLEAKDVITTHEVLEVCEDVVTPGQARASGSIGRK
jgi:hypothetical protein